MVDDNRWSSDCARKLCFTNGRKNAVAQHAVDQMHNVELVGCMLVSKTYGIPGRCQSMSVVDADEVYGGGSRNSRDDSPTRLFHRS